MSGEFRLRDEELPEIYERLCEELAVRLWEDERGRAIFAAACVRVAVRERGLELLDAEEVGAWVGITGRSVQRLAKQGVLPAPLVVGRHHRWRRGDIARYVRLSSTDANGLLDRPGGQAGGR